MTNKLAILVDSLTPNFTKNIWYAALLFWVPILVFVALANEVLEKEPLFFDTFLLTTLYSSSSPFWDNFSLFFTHLGGAIFILPVTILLTGLFWLKDKTSQAKIIAITVGGAGIMSVLLKLLFQRDRPSLWETLVVENSYSFPSGHAMASSALAFSLIALSWNTRWRWPVVTIGAIYILLIGFTRIYLGVHFPSDIIAGWSISLLWALVTYKVIFRHPKQPGIPDKSKKSKA